MLRPHSELVKGQSPDNTPFSSGKEKIFFRFLSEITASGKFGVAPHPDKKEEEAEA